MELLFPGTFAPTANVTPLFLQLSIITPITLAEAVLLAKRCHFMSIFFVREVSSLLKLLLFYCLAKIEPVQSRATGNCRFW